MKRSFLFRAGLSGAALMVVTALLLAGCGLDDSDPPGNEARFGNVVLTVPDPESGTHVSYNPPVTADQPEPSIHVYVEPASGVDDAEYPTLVIDPWTGEVVSDTLSALDPGLVDDVLASIRVVEATDHFGWPYDEVSSSRPTAIGNVSITYPDPVSGIRPFLRTVDCAGPCDSPQQLVFSKDGSSMSVDTATGAVTSFDVAPDDREAFTRLAESVTAN
jgi:hypothetical protein